jgi:succinyl-diaminopimelate desuccinylase
MAPRATATSTRAGTSWRGARGLPGECVHFNSHIDVVEVGRGWTTDPFGGELNGGKIYGRGACDMKGGLAASIIAAEAFLAVCPDFAAPSRSAARRMRNRAASAASPIWPRKGYFSPERVQHVIIPEPLNKDRICLGHRGVWWAEIETHGEIAHGSMPFLGDCAVRHMGAVVAEMETSLFPLLAQNAPKCPWCPTGPSNRP